MKGKPWPSEPFWTTLKLCQPTQTFQDNLKKEHFWNLKDPFWPSLALLFSPVTSPSLYLFIQEFS